MTLDRDIRLSPTEIGVLIAAMRRRNSELARKITKAEANRAAGWKIQNGTLERHYDELSTCNELLNTFDAARREIGRRIAAASA